MQRLSFHCVEEQPSLKALGLEEEFLLLKHHRSPCGTICSSREFAAMQTDRVFSLIR